MSGGLPRLELFCFGPPTAQVEGRAAPPEVLWRKHLALLIYLALSPNRTRAREHLLGLLWAERPDDRARHAFNEAVLRLRRCLGARRLESRKDALVLSSEHLDVDAWMLDEAEREPERALGLVRGDFLEGFTVEGASAFETWAAAERERYRSRIATVFVELGERRLAGSRLADAQDLAHRALAAEPHSEPAARLLMRAAALSGDSAGALAAFHRFCMRLAQDLGAEPSRSLLALSERVKRQIWQPASVSEPDREPPLIGRAAVHEEVFGRVADAMGGTAQVVLITGAPGMGRTRLLTECANRLALDGAVVALARPVANDHDASWSTLRLLLRSFARAPGLVAAHPDALGTLATLAPGLMEGVAARVPRDRAHVAASLAAALEAVADERPVELAIDDAHFADSATLGVLLPALEAIQSRRVMVILTAIEGVEQWPPELLGLRRELGRRVGGTSVRLTPLGVAETLSLVTTLAPWCTNAAEQDRLARRLALETGGSPFFAVTLLRALQRLKRLRNDLATWPPPQGTLEAPLPFSLPDLARSAIVARVAELDRAHQRVLTAASIGGPAIDLDVVAALVNLPRAGVEELLPELERRHLVRFDGERYTFVAILIADVVRAECLTRGQRQTMDLRAAAALAGREDLEARVLRAELLARAQAGRESFDEAVGVLRSALLANTARTARRALAAAERAATVASGADAEAVLRDLRPQVQALSRRQRNSGV